MSAELDLRAPALGIVAWAAALVALLAPVWLACAVLGLGVLGLLPRRLGRVGWLTRSGWFVAGLGVAASALLRSEAVDRSPVEALAEQGATVRTVLVVTSDPVLRRGRFSDYVVLRARTSEVSARGQRHSVRAPVLVLGDARWRRVDLGAEVSAAGRLEQAGTADLAGVLSTRGPPVVRGTPGPWLHGAGEVRVAIREAVAAHPEGPRALVPALVDGDDTGMPEELAEAFRTAGLTHLLAVSGTNLTLVVGALLLLARWAGVRSRGLVVVGCAGVVGFVLLARTEPSVVRAAAMGTVGLLGMGHHGRRRGTRALGVAVLVLLLFDPWLAVSMGFALSVLATAGILWLAPGWRDRLRRWLPLWLAEAVSVPLAAQIACTPLVAAISGQVSLVAVLANLAAAPAVGPATVLGLFGGLVGLVSDPAGRVVATPAAWCAQWIIAVAVKGAALPVAAIDWSAGPVAIGLLTTLCAATALVLGAVLARRAATAALAAVLVGVLLVPLPTPGWPPRNWVMVACDVGQGDGVVLNAGAAGAVVVDVGPDPGVIDRCLRRLDVDRIPLVVLTHFHADHVDGLEGVLRGRAVGSVQVTSLADPVSGFRSVQDVAARLGVPVDLARYGETSRLGPLTWQVVAPSGAPSPGSGSPANDSSIVLLVQVEGIRILLLGDQEEDSQSRLRRETGGVRADVLKVAHHGSASQDPDLVRGVGARLALISVGRDNDYGHPAPSLMAMLRETGARIARTDEDGDVAVTADDGRLGLSERGSRGGR